MGWRLCHCGKQLVDVSNCKESEEIQEAFHASWVKVITLCLQDKETS
jgi:hypothetical protein